MTLDALRAGGKRALARALSDVEARGGAADVLALLDAAHGAPIGVAVGLTGPPGVGKSSLMNALVPQLRARGLAVGILAVDPSSRRSGGALLGDRTRLDLDPEDERVFMRSMAARDRLGGVAELTFPALVLLRALFDVVLVETVGIGQSETDIARIADATVFCAQPGSGDALQYMKAGVMELPDLIVVNKGDMGTLAQRTAADLSGALSLGVEGARPPVRIVSARDGTGMDPVVEWLLAAGQHDRRLQRADQALAWVVEQIRLDFGRFGLAFAQKRLSTPSDRPFALRHEVSLQLRSALDFRAVTA